MRTQLIISMAFLTMSQVCFSHPLDGDWKLQSMHCSSQPELVRPLQPVPFSDFTPDMILRFVIQTNTEQQPGAEDGTIVLPMVSTKAISTNSCTKPSARAIPGIFLQQVYHQQAHFLPSQEHMGIITGVSLGVTTQITSKPISARECDTVFGVFALLFGNSHIQGELARIYRFLVQEDQLQLSYQDTLFGAQCGNDEETVLTFERTSSHHSNL